MRAAKHRRLHRFRERRSALCCTPCGSNSLNLSELASFASGHEFTRADKRIAIGSPQRTSVREGLAVRIGSASSSSFHREGHWATDRLVNRSDLPPSPTSYHLDESLLLSCCLSSGKSHFGGKFRLPVMPGRGMGSAHPLPLLIGFTGKVRRVNAAPSASLWLFAS